MTSFADAVSPLQRIFFHAFPAVILSCSIGAAAPIKATVFAHYTTWFSLGESSDMHSWPPDELPGKLTYALPRYPLLNDEGSPAFGTNHGYGGYNAIAPANMKRHIAWAKQYGIDVFAFLWDSQSGRFTQGIDAFRTVNTDMPWIIFYDTLIRFGHLGVCVGSPFGSAHASCQYDLGMKVRDGDVVKSLGQVMVDDFKNMQKNGWIDDPHYFRVEGRPVIWIFLASSFSDQSATNPTARKWYDYLNDIRQWYWENYHTEVFLVGDIAGPGMPYSTTWDSYVTRFDATSGWSPYYPGCPRDPMCDCCRPRSLTDAVLPRIKSWADAVPQKKITRITGAQSATEFAPFIMPQFDDQWGKGSSKPRMIATSKEDFRYMAEKLGRDLLHGRNWIFLSTFNAWPEATTVEPVCNWKYKNCEPDYSNDRGYYGFDFLEVIRDVFGGR